MMKIILCYGHNRGATPWCLLAWSTSGLLISIAMSNIFNDHLHKTVECYVDDISIKSHHKEDHLHDLRVMFDIVRSNQLNMNPLKSLLGVSRKFPWFIVQSKRIQRAYFASFRWRCNDMQTKSISWVKLKANYSKAEVYFIK